MGLIAANFLFPMPAWAEEKETLMYESPIFLDDGENFIPEETKTQNGKEYQLVSKRIRNAKKDGTLTYAQVTVEYDLEGDETVPEAADVPLTDETTGIEFERELPLMDTEEVSQNWSDTLSFPVTVQGYGADVFYLGNTEIPGDADLSDYGDKLLELAGLSKDYYRVEHVEWEGEPYKDGDLTCRDAKANGSKLLRRVSARYGGQIRTPDLEGKQYLGMYEEIIPETECETTESETEEAAEVLSMRTESMIQEKNMGEQQEGMMDTLMKWLQTHVTAVTISIGIIFLLIGGTGLFVLTGKKPGDESP